MQRTFCSWRNAGRASRSSGRRANSSACQHQSNLLEDLGAETFSGMSLDTAALIIPEILNISFFGPTVSIIPSAASSGPEGAASLSRFFLSSQEVSEEFNFPGFQDGRSILCELMGNL